jgi:hypothetical protein
LLSILVTKHFGGAAMHLASLSSAFGIGILSGSLVRRVGIAHSATPPWQPSKRRRNLQHSSSSGPPPRGAWR